MQYMKINFKNKSHFKFSLYKLNLLIFTIFFISKFNHSSHLNSKSISMLNRIMEQNEANNTEVNFTEYLTEILTENIIDDFSNSTENVTDNNNDESLISGSAISFLDLQIGKYSLIIYKFILIFHLKNK